MNILYQLSILLYTFAIRVTAIFNPKAKLWITGRKNIFEKLEQKLAGNTRPLIWIHCASLGEFEQGRPIIESLKEQMPETRILLTFFSPSGYEVRKNYKEADYIFYLPADTIGNAKRFIKIANPTEVIFVKYEFWFNYIQQLNKRNIPIIIVSAIFRPTQHFFKSYGGWFRKGLARISHFYVQTKESAALLQSIGITNVTISGDTRFDRVAAIAAQCKSFPLIEQFKGNHKIFLAGSSWPIDETLINTLYQEKSDLKFIIAPHEVHEEHIKAIEKLFSGKTLRYSQANTTNISQANILIIDSIGILSHLYQYAYMAYIGGAFGKGLHNILEAATFGKPVIFGPNYEKFKEAKDLIANGGAFCIHNAKELIKETTLLLSNDQAYNKASQQCLSYVNTMKGATQLIVAAIKKFNR
jgi:3-deoxy-D-manno-octulosonic-acid transferase